MNKSRIVHYLLVESKNNYTEGYLTANNNTHLIKFVPERKTCVKGKTENSIYELIIVIFVR